MFNALISVSDKTGLVEFARGLVTAGAKIYSTGGTRKHLEEAGVAVVDIASYTGFPEMMDGRLKTLHPKVFGGILCRHDRADDMAAIGQHGIEKFPLVVVNLYPFAATIAKSRVSLAEAIEQIDIGGPSLVRAAAKNHAFTAIATDAGQYAAILDEIRAHGQTSAELRFRLAAAAFAHTAAYDATIADYFAKQQDIQAGAATTFAPTVRLALERVEELRYGENPHQAAALYVDLSRGRAAGGTNLVAARKLNGKELSYNNLLDLDSALAIARSLVEDDPKRAGAVVIKHNNPCGAATRATLSEAMRAALDGDPVSAFGSVISATRPIDAATAEVLVEPNRFVEAIVAPDFEPAALEILTTKPKWKANVRLMAVGALDAGAGGAKALQLRQIDGGLLVQEDDVGLDPVAEWKVVTTAQPSDRQSAELRFAWAVCRHVKSNAIVLANDRAICGVGAGQMSRVDSTEIAIRKAGDRAKGSVLASDAFFPFPDSIHQAAAAGVAAIIQPGGSRRDEEVIAACNDHGLPMIFTGRRHFKH
ncbi:MAG: bifunctional phosphoribosylaminoimidazolecarboxamide formyltransferase/inosine monophosphate cyclohydrolase [Planctomycetota bacterium]|nr:MAG: bifunctional phosphoribosylaminoimidazolecarboxamide formyltransferase/inosine monophosphate cyclohydrolase [Planctomycetota bacterium]